LPEPTTAEYEQQTSTGSGQDGQQIGV